MTPRKPQIIAKARSHKDDDAQDKAMVFVVCMAILAITAVMYWKLK